MKSARRILEKYYILIVLLMVLVFFSIAAPRFFTLLNLTNILVQNSYLIIATIGIAMIMISSGADLSVSYQIGLVSVILGKLLTQLNAPVFIAVIVALIAGGLLGSVNGLFAVKLKVHPMVATMATMTIYQGIAYVSSNSETYFNFPTQFKLIGQGYIGIVPICVILMIISVGIGYLMLNKTYFGRYIYALGGNEEAARLGGINTSAVRIIAFIVAGIFVAIASVVLTARTGSASAGIAVDAMFTCFTACILGGISFSGGGGNVLNVVLGVLILGMLANGMQMMGLSIYSQYIAKGVLLVAAIAYDNYQKAQKLKEA
ncbi:ABC transporter permease [Konateibacter massiliensis]|uniref:ABC transporter permease n=1 Tax=Konateibacter massiliensis TaxID=2002841 RepID=UPI000C144CE3|nr:ABC transporter permease [Konateibacter massiliensis]